MYWVRWRWTSDNECVKSFSEHPLSPTQSGHALSAYSQGNITDVIMQVMPSCTLGCISATASWIIVLVVFAASTFSLNRKSAVCWALVSSSDAVPVVRSMVLEARSVAHEITFSNSLDAHEKKSPEKDVKISCTSLLVASISPNRRIACEVSGTIKDWTSLSVNKEVEVS